MILDWKKTAQKIYDNIKNEVSKLAIKPKLVAILVWNNSSSIRYIKQKEKWAKYVWINFELIHKDEKIPENELLNLIRNLNNNNSVSWFIIQLPLPGHINSQKLINTISPHKDVDWFHPENIWKNILWDDSWLFSCTPLGIIELLKEYKIEIKWKNVVILWSSNIVGKPTAGMFLNKWATVTICNSSTKDIKMFTKNADILVSATGVPGLIKRDMINEYTIVIDVWFTVIDGKLYGDCDFDNINTCGNDITPVPGWVWAMTVAMLMKNTLKAYKKK